MDDLEPDCSTQEAVIVCAQRSDRIVDWNIRGELLSGNRAFSDRGDQQIMS